MQIAGYIDHVMSRKSWNVDNYKVSFGPKSKPTPEEIEKSTARAKSRWGFNHTSSKKR